MTRPHGGRATLWIGGALLAAVVVLATLLAVKHFGGRLPGCGPQSACESLESTVWGKLPGLGWPVSFLGLAYFAALLAGWIAARAEVPSRARWLVRAGCAGSLFFLGVMIALRKFCPYCVGIHLGNLAFLVVLERGARDDGGRRMRRTLAAAAVVFVAITAVLGVARAQQQKTDAAKSETERRASTEKILAQTGAGDPARLVDLWGATGFTGRYREGPEESPIRIVMITDYQCPDCRRVEGEVQQIVAARRDVSLSVKHFPMCTETEEGEPCNRHADRNLHPNACWAARAAEAAGILKGEEGFWKMHRWLFQKGGGFTNPELKAAVTELGFDYNAFVAVMTSPETLRRVQADADEGWALGLFHTPMIFLNGVEVRGWETPGALGRTVEEVALRKPPAQRATADRPVMGMQRCIDEWQLQSVRALPADTRAWSLGAPAPAAAEVVLFGDYQEPYTAEVDKAIRAFVAGKTSVRYTFRHYPIDPTANPALPEKVRPEAIHPLAGRAAKAAEAAGSLGGAAAYWKMHAWLMEHLTDFGDETLRAAAKGMGLDPAALLAAMEKPEVSAAIAEDARAATALGVTGVPMVFINGKWVPYVRRDREVVPVDILESLGVK